MKIQPFGVELWLNEYEGRAQLNLAETSISALSVRELLALVGSDESAVEDLLDCRLSYGDIPGSPRLRQAIAGLYSTVTPERILLAHGTIGANHLAHLVLTHAGDHVVTFTPSYDQHAAIAESIGADVSVLRLTAENRYLPNVQELRDAVRENTKLICLTNPNNPTGTLIDEALLREIVGIAQSVGAYVLCDEVYRGVEREGAVASPAIADIYDRGISTAGLSKAFSLPGLRVGWVVVPEDLIARFGDQRDYSIISVGALDDALAALALENKDALLHRSRSIIARNRKIVESWLAEEPRASWIAPDAGSSALITLAGISDDRAFAIGLLETFGVLLTPGSAFDMPGYYRLGYTCDEKTLREGLQKISEYLNRQTA